MSDFYSDEEFEDTARDPEPMVVEVRGHGTKNSPVTARRNIGSARSRRSSSARRGTALRRQEENYNE